MLTVSPKCVSKRQDGPGCTVLFTGLPGSGKSTLATALQAELLRRGRPCIQLDGDQIRRGLSEDLGFSQRDRAENMRRASEVARLCTEAGLCTLLSLVSPYAKDRARCRDIHVRGGLCFVEVFVDAPLEVCCQRDPKGLYRKASAGQLVGLTGVDAPYERPAKPQLVVRTAEETLQDSTRRCLSAVLAETLRPMPDYETSTGAFRTAPQREGAGR